MNYNIGQFKKSTLADTEYYVALNDSSSNTKFNTGTIASAYGGSAQDGYLTIAEEGFKQNQIYHLTFMLEAVNFDSNMSKKVFIKLYESAEKFQTIKIINVTDAVGGTYVDIAFVPKFDCKYLVFEIVRNSTTVNDMNYYRAAVDSVQGKILNNIIMSNKFGAGSQKILKKIGIQGPPGLGFVVNGEMLILGQSGIYESNNMDIKSLGFILTDKKDTNPITTTDFNFFIVDYLY